MYDIGIDRKLYEARLLISRKGRSCPSCMRRSIVCNLQEDLAGYMQYCIACTHLPHASIIYKSRKNQLVPLHPY
jgi:hypothetical protein